MKKLIIGLIVIGFTSLSFSQTAALKLSDIDFSEVIVSPLNISYLNKVQEASNPKIVNFLEHKASRYNIKKSDIYNSDHNMYEVTFTQSNGKITAYYDKTGKIIRSNEKFKNVKIPLTLRQVICKDNPGWSIERDTYIINYKYGEDIERFYKIQLRKGNLKKNLKIDIQGNIM